MAKGSLNSESRRSLAARREEIDRVDGEILSLLCRRQAVAASIGEIKRALGAETYDPAREKQVLERLVSSRPEGLTPESVRRIFTEIISASRSIQGPFETAFLGPEATFSHQAAINLFGRSTSFRPAETIQEVFDLVERGTCQRGVVPVENSFEGSVAAALDCLCRYDLKIESELLLRVRHHLLSRRNGTAGVEKVYSHPMGLAQCRIWLKGRMPGAQWVEASSTSRAAESAASEPNAAAVGSRLAARRYGLNLVAEHIEDHPGNVTRFLAIGRRDAEPTGKDKTSIVFSLGHEPGSLHRALAPLACAGVNLTRIESRPMKTRNWEYLFFVDVEGHEKEEGIGRAFKEMANRCAFLKRLGSYPSGGEPCD